MDMAETIIFAIELLGTAAFALSGVLAARERALDPFGALVLGLATAVGGGALRDVLLGVYPILMFRRPVYALTALGVSAAAVCLLLWSRGKGWFRRHGAVERITDTVDAVGLSVFAPVGVRTAIAAGYAGDPFVAVFVGIITGIGGGILRDMLANRLPVVLHKRVYALAAAAGSIVYYFLYSRVRTGYLPLAAGACVTFLIRFLAARYRWDLPRLKTDGESD